MPADNSGAAGSGVTHFRDYSVSLQQAAAAIFGISPSSSSSRGHPPRPVDPSDKMTGKISES